MRTAAAFAFLIAWLCLGLSWSLASADIEARWACASWRMSLFVSIALYAIAAGKGRAPAAPSVPVPGPSCTGAPADGAADAAPAPAT